MIESAKTITEAKWGPSVAKAGFQIVPDLLLKNQGRLGLGAEDQPEAVSAPEMVVLLNVLMHWWTRDSVPFPSANAMADRIGVNRRSIDRAVEGLVKKKLLKKMRKGNLVMYDPEPLVTRMEQLSKEPLKTSRILGN